MLSLENLTIRLGSPEDGRVLVQDVDLALERGRMLGVVGESGSGKSLTARAIIGLLPRGLVACGEVRFQGASLLTMSEREMRGVRGGRIGLLMQDPFTMLNPLQTVGATIEETLPATTRARAEVKPEVERRLAEVALPADVAGRYPFQLSGGMRQRAALAAALARDPELLIADEPTTALDVTTQDEILKLLRDIQQRRGMSIILITHDLRVAFSVCDEVQVMYAGSVVERAPASQLRHNPLHPYSSSLLLAELPVSRYVEQLNMVPGRVPAAHTVAQQCAFAARCAWAEERCVARRPQLEEVGATRWSACLRVGEIADELESQVSEADAVSDRPVAAALGAGLVVAESLTKTYHSSRLFGSRESVRALDDVSFEIVEGESVGLVGETGSGKSTIARCLLGLNRPDAGRITIDGVDATDHRKLGRRDTRHVRTCVQAVFQDPYASLNPALTVGSALREVLEFRQDGNVEKQAVGELLDSVGLPASYASRRPAELSGGERQRIAIARALAMQPRLLICDEPVAALDVSAQAVILDLLRQVRRERGMSMLFITHDLSVVRQMSERLIVLYRGNIVEAGDTDTVLDRPAHDYTRTLRAAAGGTLERAIQ
jgi:peptide/nickel transport system ATP-binding protein